MVEVPIISRLTFRDYQALVFSMVILFLESLLRVVTWCLPEFLLNFFREQSRTVFKSMYKDERTTVAMELQNAESFVEMVRYWDYPVEEHIVKTGDDYLLGVHRIPHGKYSIHNSSPAVESFLKQHSIDRKHRNGEKSSSKTKDGIKPVVLLYHGFLMCSEVWVCNLQEERRLPFLLAEAGYDVWFGNARGNKYSMKHMKNKPDDTLFWEFSMDEFAMYDLPDTIDYILDVTGAQSLAYIGFSQGTAQAFAALSIQPKLNNKVNLFVALAPATSPKGLQNPIVDAFVKASPQIVYLFLGRSAALSITLFWQTVLYPPIYTKLLDRCMNILFGWHSQNMSESQKAVSYYHLYSYASVKSLVHWFQIIRAGNFQMYNEFPSRNPFRNNASGHIPHSFPTTQIKAPIAVFYGGSDSLVDINVLLKQLPKPVLCKEIKEYEHLDFLWGSKVHEYVYPELFDLLAKHSVRQSVDGKTV